ncbi:MAG: hypothetical protein AB2689_22685 [Candidatus Thiodiazotropha taylori]
MPIKSLILVNQIFTLLRFATFPLIFFSLDIRADLINTDTANNQVIYKLKTDTKKQKEVTIDLYNFYNREIYTTNNLTPKTVYNTTEIKKTKTGYHGTLDRKYYIQKVISMEGNQPISLFDSSVPNHYKLLANNILDLEMSIDDITNYGSAVILGTSCDKAVTNAHNIYNQELKKPYTYINYRYLNGKYSSLDKLKITTGWDDNYKNGVFHDDKRKTWATLSIPKNKNNTCLNVGIKNKASCNGEIFLLAYHIKKGLFDGNKLLITRHCEISEMNEGHRLLELLENAYGKPDSNAVSISQHFCSSYPKSSGGGLFCNENGHISFLGINEGGIAPKEYKHRRYSSTNPPSRNSKGLRYGLNYFNLFLRLEGKFLKSLISP